MILKYTEEQEQQIEKIREEYGKKINDIYLNVPEEERATQIKDILNDRGEAIKKCCDTFEREFFEPFRGKSAEVLRLASDQIKEILESYRDTLIDYYYRLQNMAEENGQEFKEDNCIYIADNQIFLRADFIYKYIVKDDFYLLYEDLAEDPANLEKLDGIVKENIAACSWIRGEIKEQIEDTQQNYLIRESLPIVRKTLIPFDRLNSKIILSPNLIEEIDGQLHFQFAIDQNGKSEKQVPTYISLTYNGDNLQINKKLKKYDMAVYDTVSSIYQAWKYEDNAKTLVITADQIYRNMNGIKDNKKKAPPNELKRISQSMEKMQFTAVYMDVSEEINAGFLTMPDERQKKGIIRDNLLNMTCGYVLNQKGKEIEAYQIYKEPILYTYNRYKKRILSLPIDLLDTSAYLSNSQNVVEFRQYLLYRIGLLKKGNLKNEIIKIDTIYEATAIEKPADRNQQKRDREKIEAMLTCWADKEYIKSWEQINKDGTKAKQTQPIYAYKISV